MANHLPRLSIVILLQDLHRIDQLLVHILAQNMKEFEVLIAHYTNDNPVDQIIDKWQDSRLRYIKIPRGLNSIHLVYEWVLKEARGQFTYFLSCRSLLLANSVESLINTIESNPNTCVIHNSCSANKFGRLITPKSISGHYRVLNQNEYLKVLCSPIFASQQTIINNLLIHTDKLHSPNSLFQLAKIKIQYFYNIAFLFNVLLSGITIKYTDDTHTATIESTEMSICPNLKREESLLINYLGELLTTHNPQ